MTATMGDASSQCYEKEEKTNRSILAKSKTSFKKKPGKQKMEEAVIDILQKHRSQSLRKYIPRPVKKVNRIQKKMNK